MAKKVRRICAECAQIAGKKESQLDHKARFYKGRCDICEQAREVCDTNWWGYFTPVQIEHGRAELRRLGLHISQKAKVEDVRRLIDVVKGVLDPDFMSFETRSIVAKMEADLDAGNQIQLWDTKMLSTWYGADCVQMKYAKEAQEAEDERLHPSPVLHVVECGRESTIRVARKDRHCE
jgi:hypothetical protein